MIQKSIKWRSLQDPVQLTKSDSTFFLLMPKENTSDSKSFHNWRYMPHTLVWHEDKWLIDGCWSIKEDEIINKYPYFCEINHPDNFINYPMW